MKRFWMIALVLGLIAGFGLATAFSVVQAQSDPPQTPQTPWGQGMMGRRGGMMGGGMMGGYGQQSGQTQTGPAVMGVMHEYMEAVLSEKLGMTLDEYEQLCDEGQTFWQIAEAQGASAEDAQQMMIDARVAALDQMVVDGVITQEQADFMKTRMSGRMGGMNGAGGCQGGGMRGWN